MIELLRDSAWQFASVLLGLIALAVTILIFLNQRSNKRLAYTVISSSRILSKSLESEGKLQILFQSQPVSGVLFTIWRVINTGNQPIESQDYEGPVAFTFGPEARVLSAEISDTSPKSLKPELVVLTNSINFKPILLNRDDWFEIRCLLTNSSGIEPQARISGVKDLKRLKEPSVRQLLLTFFLALILIVTAMVLPDYVIGRRPPDPHEQERVWVEIPLFVMGLLVYFAPIIKLLRSRTFRRAFSASFARLLRD